MEIIHVASACSKYMSDHGRMLVSQDWYSYRMDASGLEVQNHCPRSKQASVSHSGVGIAVILEFFNLW